MNKKGFTLVELLAAFVILGLLLLIAVPTVITFLEQAEVEFTETQKRLIIQAATLYVEDEKNEISSLKTEGGTLEITLQHLGNKGYITLPIYDAKSKKEIDATTVVILVKRTENGRLEYSITGVK